MQINTKGVHGLTWLGGEGDTLEIVQESEISTYYQMALAQTRIRPGEWDTENTLGFWGANRLSNPGQKTRAYGNW